MFKFILFLMPIQLALIRDAYAYLDPATGSMIFQAIIAAVVGVAAIVKLYWYRLKAFFFRSSLRSDTAKTDSPPDRD